MDNILKEFNKVLTQYHEGAITYIELMLKVVTILPPPCDNPDVDDIYKYLIRGIVDSTEAEKKAAER